MLKKTIEDIKLSKLSYLLDQLKTKDINTKFKIFKKIDKMNISTKMGLELLDASTYDYGIDDGNGGINSSLVSLCLKDYKKEYSDKILKLFNEYSEECKDKIVYMLSSVDNEEALKLYSELVIKYYKKSKLIPISNLYERTDSYKILFPKLYEAVKYNNYKNNILVLINDYLNAGVIPDEDLKKHKRVLQNAITKIINESFKFKFSSTSRALKNPKYKDLRYFLEIVVNLEYYVSSKSTKALLDKLYKRNDNQLKLFILENYIKKLKNLKKIGLASIAKDNASRYPLYELLTIYERVDSFPKNYLTPELIAESDLFINFVLVNGYDEVPTNMKFIKTIEIDGHTYYVFTFKYSYYDNTIYDSTTNYLIKESGLDKYKDKKITSTFVGLSGGYNPNSDIYLVETTNNKILWNIKKEKESIDSIVDKIKSTLSINEEKEIEKTVEEEPEVKKGLRFRFAYILLLLFIMLIGTIVFFFKVLEKPEILNIDTNKNIQETTENQAKKTKLQAEIKFKEINGHDLFKQSEQSYYVLLYKKKGDKNSYFDYLNTLVNHYPIYYVDLNKEENKFLYGPNDLNFTVKTDRYLKVSDGDFEFYVDEKENILDELESEVKEIIKKEKQEVKNKK